MITWLWSAFGPFISLLPVITLLYCSPIKSWWLFILILAAYYFLSTRVFPMVFAAINIILWIVGAVFSIIRLPWWYTVIYFVLFAFLVFARLYINKHGNGQSE